MDWIHLAHKRTSNRVLRTQQSTIVFHAHSRSHLLLHKNKKFPNCLNDCIVSLPCILLTDLMRCMKNSAGKGVYFLAG
jgi:hypothetical protein